MVSFQGIRKFNSYLVKAKIFPLGHNIGSYGCGKKRCQVCLNVTETNSFTRTATTKTYKINYMCNCSEKCLVYLLTCQTCS